MYDTGVKLKINNAPEESYTVELEDGRVLVPVDDVISLPNDLFTRNNDILLYIVVEGQGGAINTLAKITIPVNWRPTRGT